VVAAASGVHQVAWQIQTPVSVAMAVNFPIEAVVVAAAVAAATMVSIAAEASVSGTY